MKNLIIMILSILPLYADASSFSGSANLQEQTFKDLEVKGSLKFNNIKVENEINIAGSVKGRNISGNLLNVSGTANINEFDLNDANISGTCYLKNGKITNDLIVNGSLHLNNSHVKNNSIVSGNIKSSYVTFGNLTATSSQITLDHCIVEGNIHIKTSKLAKWLNKHTKLVLKGHTIIHGDIIFDHKNGEIIKDDNIIIHGQINGLANDES